MAIRSSAIALGKVSPFFGLEKCPYNLPIPDLLKENVVLFKDYVKQF